MLEGEDSLINVDAECQLFHALYPGKLLVTTYRVIFLPADPEIYKRHRIRIDFFRLPLGLISKYLCIL